PQAASSPSNSPSSVSVPRPQAITQVDLGCLWARAKEIDEACCVSRPLKNNSPTSASERVLASAVRTARDGSEVDTVKLSGIGGTGRPCDHSTHNVGACLGFGDEMRKDSSSLKQETLSMSRATSFPCPTSLTSF